MSFIKYVFASVFVAPALVAPALLAQLPTHTTLAISSSGSAVATIREGTVVTLTATVTLADGTTATLPGEVNFCDVAVQPLQCTDIRLLGTAALQQGVRQASTSIPALAPTPIGPYFLARMLRQPPHHWVQLWPYRPFIQP